MTYFDIPMAGKTYPGVYSISNTSLRVKSDNALLYWAQRFDEFEVPHAEVGETFGRGSLVFQDFEGSPLMLTVDDGTGIPYGIPWTKAGIPEEFAIIGLGSVTLTVRKNGKTAEVLTEILGFQQIGSYPPKSGKHERYFGVLDRKRRAGRRNTFKGAYRPAA